MSTELLTRVKFECFRVAHVSISNDQIALFYCNLYAAAKINNDNVHCQVFCVYL